MCFNDCWVVVSVRDEGDYYAFEFMGRPGLSVRKEDCQIVINTELGDKILFYPERIPEIWANDIWALMDVFDGIKIPDKTHPCTGCHGTKCSVVCRNDQPPPSAAAAFAC
ncbi:MAG: hypothetical protein NTZ49_03575 [Candidatus Parcubacteria bacterium]|nr:hypothetical protein [Candidatus Parcubacteria bacterium]